MKLQLKKGSTSNIFQIFIADSSSTTGGGLTGLLFNTASLTAYYHRDTDTTATVISLVTMTVGTFTSLGFKEIDATNMPGWYQFCPPNAALASGANNVAFHLKGATNMAPLPIEVQLVSYDPYDATALGLTALPAVAAGASGGLPLSVDSSGRVDVLKVNGTSQTARDLGATLGAAGAGLTALGDTRIANLDTTVSSRLAPAGTLATVTALTNAPTAGDFTAAMKTSLNNATPASVVGAVGSVTGNVGGNVVGSVASVTAAVTAGTVSDKTGYALTAGEHTLVVADVNTALDAAGTELTTIPGSTATLRQKISAVWQYLMFKRTTTTSTETLFKADGSTSLGTSTVSDDGTTATHGKIA